MSDSKRVVTGQQIGLLGGPLYTTYKVLGAVFHARQTGGEGVYWLETNDADFNEINHVDYLDSEGKLRNLTWDIPTQGFSCGYIAVDDKLVQLLETFFSTIRQTEFTAMLREIALGCYAPGRMLGDASTMLAKELFASFGIRIFTPFDQEFRAFSQSILRKEAENTPDGEQCNLFCMVGYQRKTVFKKGGGFVLRDRTVIDLHDYELVPNVKTRSVCQDAFFNTYMYVAGPGEVKYLGDLDHVFNFHGVKRAQVQPRMSLVLLEPRAQRLLKRAGLRVGDVMDHSREDLIKTVLKKSGDFDFDAAWEKGMNLAEDLVGKLKGLGLEEEELKGFQKTLQQEVKNTLGKWRARMKEKHGQAIADAGFLWDNLFPYGKPQERVFNIFYYMNLFGGKEFLGFLYKNYDPGSSMKILEI